METLISENKIHETSNVILKNKKIKSDKKAPLPLSETNIVDPNIIYKDIKWLTGC